MRVYMCVRMLCWGETGRQEAVKPAPPMWYPLGVRVSLPGPQSAWWGAGNLWSWGGHREPQQPAAEGVCFLEGKVGKERRVPVIA